MKPIIGAEGPLLLGGCALAMVERVVETQDDESYIWDVYAHDFEQSDITRVMVLTNLKAEQRDLLRLLGDLGWAVMSPFSRLLGYYGR